MPVKRDCFNFLLRQWRADLNIMGYRMRHYVFSRPAYHHDNIVNGAAFYAKKFWSFIKSKQDTEVVFDNWTTYEDGNAQCVDLNEWYLCLFNEYQLDITPSIRLVHGIKDDSLLDRVLRPAGNLITVSDTFRAITTHLLMHAN